MRLRPYAASLLAMLAGCAASTDYLEYKWGGPLRPLLVFVPGAVEFTPNSLVTGYLPRLMKKCWYAEGEESFDRFIYTPEVNAGKPRILIVERDNPNGLPKLVIEGYRKGEATRIGVFGPLLASNLGPRIRADLRRWMNGNPDCA